MIYLYFIVQEIVAHYHDSYMEIVILSLNSSLLSMMRVILNILLIPFKHFKLRGETMKKFQQYSKRGEHHNISKSSDTVICIYITRKNSNIEQKFCYIRDTCIIE